MHLISKIPYRFMGAGLIGGLCLLFRWPMVFIPPIAALAGWLCDLAFDNYMEKKEAYAIYDGTRNGKDGE